MTISSDPPTEYPALWLLATLILTRKAVPLAAPEAGAGRTPVRVKKSSKVCYYGAGIYSLGACRDGQRCVRGTDDEDYWEDGQGCTQTGSGTGGGFRQV